MTFSSEKGTTYSMAEKYLHTAAMQFFLKHFFTMPISSAQQSRGPGLEILKKVTLPLFFCSANCTKAFSYMKASGTM